MCQMKNGLKEDVNVGALVDAKSTSATGRKRGNGLSKNGIKHSFYKENIIWKIRERL